MQGCVRCFLRRGTFPKETRLDQSMVLEWAVRRENESKQTFNNRCGFIAYIMSAVSC